jgi:hypothetical protein
MASAAQLGALGIVGVRLLSGARAPRHVGHL